MIYMRKRKFQVVKFSQAPQLLSGRYFSSGLFGSEESMKNLFKNCSNSQASLPSFPACVQTQLTSTWPGLAGSLILNPCVYSHPTDGERGTSPQGVVRFVDPSAAPVGQGSFGVPPPRVHVQSQHSHQGGGPTGHTSRIPPHLVCS